MQSFQEVFGRRVGESHVVFDLYGSRWLLRVDMQRGEPLLEVVTLRFRGVVKLECSRPPITRMVIPRVSYRSSLAQFHRNDVSVWRAANLPGAPLMAERLDEARARILWHAGPTPPDAPPCIGLPASRWRAPDPTTTFVLPNGDCVLAVLYPARFYGRGEWMPLSVRPAADDPDEAPAVIVAAYDYGRERRFASLEAFLAAHDIATDGESYHEQDPRALDALAQIVGLPWQPTHRIVYHDREGGDDSAVWFVDASAAIAALAGEGPKPAPSFGEELRGAPAMFALNRDAQTGDDASDGWTREGVSLVDAHPQDRPYYEVEALHPSP